MLNKKNGTDGGESFKNNFMNIAVILPILYHCFSLFIYKNYETTLQGRKKLTKHKFYNIHTAIKKKLSKTCTIVKVTFT